MKQRLAKHTRAPISSPIAALVVRIRGPNPLSEADKKAAVDLIVGQQRAIEMWRNLAETNRLAAALPARVITEQRKMLDARAARKKDQ